MQLSNALYTIVRPGKMVREFETSRDAVEFLVENPGEAYLHGPDGLIMTKGVLTPHRETANPLVSQQG